MLQRYSNESLEHTQVAC